MRRWRLGLDIGSNTIGWAAIDLDQNGRPAGIFDGGVVVFPDGRDAKSKEPRNVERRLKRSQRHRLRAKAWRKRMLAETLAAAGVLPQADFADALTDQGLLSRDPYLLRAEALDRPLSKAELAVVLLHLANHRGFRSNAIGAAAEDTNELKLWDERERDLRAAMAKRNYRTVGELFAAYRQDPSRSGAVRMRAGGGGDAIAPTRRLISEELDALIAAQAPHHDLREAWDRVREYILDQRPLRPPEVGLCEFEYEAGERRASAALPTAAAFRIAQDLCHLRVGGIDPECGVVEPMRALTEEEWRAGFDKLSRSERVTWDQLRKAMSLHDWQRFNLETAGARSRKSLNGDLAGALLGHPDAFGPRWHDLGLEERDRIVSFLLEHRSDPEAIRVKATMPVSEGGWGLSQTGGERCAEAAVRRFGTRRAALSLKAMRKILPNLTAGESYASACAKAGYHHSYRQSQLRARLPYYGEVLRGSTVGGTLKPGDPAERRWGRVTNITVHVALNRLRELVNTLIRRHGAPEQASVELLRSLKAGAQERRELERRSAKRQQENRDLDEEIEAALRQAGRTGIPGIDRGEARRRWRYWVEQDRRCLYTGKPLSVTELFTVCEIDHIVPRSRGGFERPDNEALVLASVNRRKGERTPWQAFHEATDPEVDWEALLARVERLPPGKQRRFGPDAIGTYFDEGEEGWLPRQLADAGWAARMALAYLRTVIPEVWATRGQLTASLRRFYGLRKEREDIANHFVDAVVVGLTDRGAVQRYSRMNALGRRPSEEERLPFPDFHEHVESIRERLVPHFKPNPGTSGELHNDTLYSLWKRIGDGTNTRYERVRLGPRAALPPDAAEPRWRRAVRRAITDLFPESGLTPAKAESALAQIVDPGFRARVNRLCDEEDLDLPAAIRRHLAERGSPGAPIRRIECFLDTTDMPLTKMSFVPRGAGARSHAAPVRPDANHRLDVFESNGKWRGVVVSRYDAVRQTHARPFDAASPVMTLHIGDLIEIERDGAQEVWTVKSLITGGRIRLWPSRLSSGADTDARLRYGFKDRTGWEMSNADALRRRGARKLYVDPAGRASVVGGCLDRGNRKRGAASLEAARVSRD